MLDDRMSFTMNFLYGSDLVLHSNWGDQFANRYATEIKKCHTTQISKIFSQFCRTDKDWTSIGFEVTTFRTYTKSIPLTLGWTYLQKKKTALIKKLPSHFKTLKLIRNLISISFRLAVFNASQQPLVNKFGKVRFQQNPKWCASAFNANFFR